MKKQNGISLLLLFILSILFLLVFYGNVVFKPNSYLFNESGDAIKNYFTYASHLKEQSVVDSKIMNYPYGENFLYLDCQPAFSVILKILAVPFPAIINYSIGFINFLMVFSLVLTSIFLYLLFKALKVSTFISIAGAFSIAVLAPQIFRMTGHFALSYSFVIPLTWLLFIKFQQSSAKLKWSIIILINNLFWFFVHAYLGMIISAFILLYMVFDLVIFRKDKLETLNEYLYLILQSIVPLLVFWMFISLSDDHIGRTNNQYGFLLYTANIDSVFFPNHPPFKDYFTSLQLKQEWEGWAYIGIGSLIFIVLFIVNRIIRFFSNISFADDSSLLKNRILIPGLISSVILLLISMGYPFKWNMEYLLDNFSIIKSFRGIGRFAWVFYYVITVTSVYFTYLVYSTNRIKILKVLPAIVVISLFLIEGLPYHAEISKTISQHNNAFNKSMMNEAFLKGLSLADKEKYQAIIPFPYYHIGSENYGKAATDKIYRLSMFLAYHSEIPLMSNYSTRTSIPESKSLMQIFAPPYYDKSVALKISDDRPFLLLYSMEDLSEFERRLLDQSIPLFANNEFSLYEISHESLFKNISAEVYLNYQNIGNTLTENRGFKTTKNTFIAYSSFEDTPMEITFRGAGALKAEKKNYIQLLKIPTDSLNKADIYVASYWIYNEGPNYGQDVLNSLTFVQAEDKNGRIEWLTMTNPLQSPVINGSWSLVELNFNVPEWATDIAVFIKGDDNSSGEVLVDDILIRAKNNEVYKVMPDSKDLPKNELLYNNHRIIIDLNQTQLVQRN